MRSGYLLFLALFTVVALSEAPADSESVALTVVEDTNVDVCTEDGECSVEASQPMDVFEPTNDWKEILPNEAIPPGLHVRMNLETGKKEAKFMDPKDKKGIEPSDASTVSVDSLYNSLATLPQPPMINDMPLEEAHEKLSKEEFRAEIIRLWKKRQAMLVEAFASMENTATRLQSLIQELIDENVTTQRQLVLLEEIEWEVQDLDKAKDFHTLGGLDVIVRQLNASDFKVRAMSAWVIGSAVKHYEEAQHWALESGAMPLLLDSLVEHRSDREASKDILELQKKVLYAIGSILRNNARAQRAFVVYDGHAALGNLLEVKTDEKLILKAVALIRDLIQEKTEVSESALIQLQQYFTQPKWCAKVLALLGSKNTDTLKKLLELLVAVRETCQEDLLKSEETLSELRLRYVEGSDDELITLFDTAMSKNN